VITVAAFVVTVCEFTVGVPRVGVGALDVVKVALRVFGVTAKKTDPGSWLTVVPWRREPLIDTEL
jgi:hypothetical protein